jgi:hypothetical protein
MGDERYHEGFEAGFTSRDEDVAKLTAARDAADTELRIVRGSCDEAHAEVERLRALINTPRTDDFFDAVRIESAHQVERWGVEHDAGKRAEDWITLYTYLLGKAATAHFAGDRDKLLHHIITVAAVALNWHRNMTGESTLMRPGIGPSEEVARG